MLDRHEISCGDDHVCTHLMLDLSILGEAIVEELKICLELKAFPIVFLAFLFKHLLYLSSVLVYSQAAKKSTFIRGSLLISLLY